MTITNIELKEMLKTIRQLRKTIEAVKEGRIVPDDNESQEDFLGRCMASSMMNVEYPDPDQRYAVCMSYWDGSKLYDNPCWSGYVAYGLKPDGTPNCIPEE
jgi:hypothetical protein